MIEVIFFVSCGLAAGFVAGFIVSVRMGMDLLERQGLRIEELETERDRSRLLIAELTDSKMGA